MHASDAELLRGADTNAAGALGEHDAVRSFFGFLPRPLRFFAVGVIGLTVDLAVFTLAVAHIPQPLLARLLSLGVATFITWRLNRALTFERSGRRPGDEALRYAAVAASAQAMSYAVFAVLVLTVCAAVPQLALLGGSAIAALVSYKGQALFAFRRGKGAP
jgi:putative flippase GtrA